MNKKAIESSFVWIFAIVVGIFILFLAIFLSSKIFNAGGEASTAKTGKEISVLLNPLETSFESSQTTYISVSLETRINNFCTEFGEFGEQEISLDQKSFNQWSKTDTEITFENKYIFSNDEVVGNGFYIFSKPFSMPFKIADLIYLTSEEDNYCFEDSPNDVKEEIQSLNQDNLFFENCTEEMIQVCASGNCDIKISSNYVSKDGELMYFGENDALMYAAIFSDKTIYECQLKRLMTRLSKLCLIYENKEIFTQLSVCENDLGNDLERLGALAESLEDSSGIGSVENFADYVEDTNEGRLCNLW